MRYYQMTEYDTLTNILRPRLPSASDIWSGTTPLVIVGTVSKSEEPVQFLSFYQSNIVSKAFMVSMKTWDIWKEMQKIVRFRPCAFGHVETRLIRPYMLLMPTVQEVLHEDSVFFQNGELRSICLCEEQIRRDCVFAVKGQVQTHLIINEAVLEEMLRAGVTEFRYEQIEVRRRD